MQGQDVVTERMCYHCGEHVATLFFQFGTLMTGYYCESTACIDYVNELIDIAGNEVNHIIERVQ